MKKTILITGASGFIGSFLVEKFLDMGYEVYAGVRKTSSKEYLKDPRIRFLELDLSNKAGIMSILKKQVQSLNFIIHNAGVTKSLKKSDFDIVNYQYTRNLIEAVLESEIKLEKFLYVSSLAAYGPGKEDILRPVKLYDTPAPVSLYGASKLKAELYLYSQENFPFLIVRPTGVYGPRESDYLVMYKAINKGVETYIGTSKQYLTFIYINDLVGIISRLIESDIIHKAYFISDLKIYTAKEFSGILKSLLGKRTVSIVFPKFLVRPIAYINEKAGALVGKVPTLNTQKYRDIKHKNWTCDSSQVYEDLNCQPQYDLEQGLTETIEWCKNRNLL